MDRLRHAIISDQPYFDGKIKLKNHPASECFY
jgi:hypothetical protein